MIYNSNFYTFPQAIVNDRQLLLQCYLSLVITLISFSKVQGKDVWNLS